MTTAASRIANGDTRGLKPLRPSRMPKPIPRNDAISRKLLKKPMYLTFDGIQRMSSSSTNRIAKLVRKSRTSLRRNRVSRANEVAAPLSLRVSVGMVATSAESVVSGVRALPGGGGGRLRDALGLQPPLRVDRCLAAIGRGRDRLAVAVVVHVPGDEDAVDLRVRLVGHDQVALVVDVEPVFERVGVRLVTDGDEQALDRFVDFVAVDRVAQAQPLDLVLAEDVRDLCVPAHADLGVLQRALLHDLAAAKPVAPVQQHDLSREARQERGLLERRVATAD